MGELELCHFISKPDRWTKVNLATKFNKHNELSSDSLHVQHPHSEVVQDGRWIQDLRAQHELLEDGSHHRPLRLSRDKVWQVGAHHLGREARARCPFLRRR